MSMREQLLNWIELQAPGPEGAASHLFVIIWIVVCAIVIHSFLRRVVLRIISSFKFINIEGSWLHTLNSNRLFHHMAMVLQGVIVRIQAGVWLDEADFLNKLIGTVSDLWILFYGLMALFSFLDTFQAMINRRIEKSHVPLRGIIQTTKLILSLLIGLIGVSILIGKSPVILLSGLGALSAVLMLVFKDPILGLVAGIQLSVNNMLAVGDWLEMPKYNADGDVIDIGLTTVKVQNWDKTITTIPTYALISDSFKNWRGMSDSGGRRIKRSLLINTTSIRFLENKDLDHLMKSRLLEPYLKDKVESIKRLNSKIDMTLLINGRRLTNIGTFRKYLFSYLSEHPAIHKDRTLIVRQLAPSSEGLPIEIYAFTNTTVWDEYENIQSDIFDHIFAILTEFDLLAHESPTGSDIRDLVKRP